MSFPILVRHEISSEDNQCESEWHYPYVRNEAKASEDTSVRVNVFPYCQTIELRQVTIQV